MARPLASDAGREVTASAIQAHGGIGFTWEAECTGCTSARSLTRHCSAARNRHRRICRLSLSDLFGSSAASLVSLP